MKLAVRALSLLMLSAQLAAQAPAFQAGATPSTPDINGLFSFLDASARNRDKSVFAATTLLGFGFKRDVNDEGIFERQSEEGALRVVVFRDPTGAIRSIKMFWLFRQLTILPEQAMGALIAKSAEPVTLDDGASLRIVLNRSGTYEQDIIVSMTGRLSRSEITAIFN